MRPLGRWSRLYAPKNLPATFSGPSPSPRPLTTPAHHDPPAARYLFVRRWPSTLILLAALGTLAAYALGGPSRPYLHFALAQLCHGVSGGKIAFLLLFIAAVATSLAFAPAHTRANTSPLSRRLWFVLAAGLAASITSFLFYVLDLGLPIGVPTFHWRDGVNSVNSLTHIHTSKSAIALLLHAFGGDALNARFDTGAAYLAAVPSPLAIFIGLCFIAACTISIVESRSVVARFEPATRPLIALVYAVAAANACKSILDGGPLAYDCVASLLILALLRGSPGLAGIGPWLKTAAKPALLALALWVAILLMLQPGAIDRHPGLLAYRLAILATPLALSALLLAFLQSSTPKTLKSIAGFAAASLAGVAIVIHFASQAAQTSLWPLQRISPQAALLLSPQWDACAHIDLPKDATFAQAYALAGDNPLRVRHVSFRDPGDNTPSGFYGQLVIPPGRPWALDPNAHDPGPIAMRRCDPIDDSRRPSFRIQIESDGQRGPKLCPPANRPLTILDDHERFVAYHALDARLRRGGLREYVLVPYIFYEQTKPAESPVTQASINPTDTP